MWQVNVISSPNLIGIRLNYAIQLGSRDWIDANDISDGLCQTHQLSPSYNANTHRADNFYNTDANTDTPSYCQVN